MKSTIQEESTPNEHKSELRDESEKVAQAPISNLNSSTPK